MKKLLSLYVIIAGCALAQFVPTPKYYSSAGAPTSGSCASTADIGANWFQTGDPANGFTGTFICQQTGAASLGSGAFAWVGLGTQGTSPTTGTLTVANGKTAVISNSLTWTGTDATSFAFPSTSGTVVTLAATQTLTNKTLTTPTITAPVVSTITNTGTLTLPVNTGGLPVLYGCGATSGNAACANTSGGSSARVITGLATLASNSAVISGISPAFTSTSTFSCTSNDQTTVGNPTKIVNTSSSSITISNTTGASDVVAYVCIGY